MRGRLFHPRCPLNFIILTADTCANSLCPSVAHTPFMMIDIPVLNEEWGAWKAI